MDSGTRGSRSRDSSCGEAGMMDVEEGCSSDLKSNARPLLVS
jgi:hypothetical protein